jgi:hypothetical protein
MIDVDVVQVYRNKKLHFAAIVVFVLILILTGTYFRNRPGGGVPTIDWLVIARLIACTAAFLVGILLLLKRITWGFGTCALTLYVLAAGLSAVFSEYPLVVGGYVLLLLGTSVLMMALVHYANSAEELAKIERIWFLTICVLVVKDTMTYLMFPDMRPSGEDDIGRLGMGVTHPTQLSLYAVILFWLSFNSSRIGTNLLIWLWRVFLILVILAARSRGPMMAFAVGALFYSVFSGRERTKRWIISLGIVLAISALFVLSLELEQNWAGNISEYMKRGQDAEGLSSFTGRTFVWQNALRISADSPLIGHGYGISKVTLGESLYDEYHSSHAHNEILESLVTTGLVGLIPLLMMMSYSLLWIIDHGRLRRVFSKDISIHALCLVVILIMSSFTESWITTRISPVQPLFFFYLLILDRRRDITISDRDG